MASETQSRPEDGAFKNPTGSPEPGDHEPKSFGADGSVPGGGRDRRLDYGNATANAGDGTGDLTAGPAVADALPPDAVAERADIAADDAGASAFAEAAGEQRTGRLDDDESNPTTEGSGAMASDVQGQEVDPGAG